MPIRERPTTKSTQKGVFVDINGGMTPAAGRSLSSSEGHEMTRLARVRDGLPTFAAMLAFGLAGLHCSGTDSQTIYRLSFPSDHVFVCSQGTLSQDVARSATEGFVTPEYASLVRTSPSDYALDLAGRSFSGKKEGDGYTFTATNVSAGGVTYTVDTKVSLQVNGQNVGGTVDIDVASTCSGAGCQGVTSARCRQSIAVSGVEVETAF